MSPQHYVETDFEIWLSSRSSHNLTSPHVITNMTRNILATAESLSCLRLRLMEKNFQCLQTDHGEHWEHAFQRA